MTSNHGLEIETGFFASAAGSKTEKGVCTGAPSWANLTLRRYFDNGQLLSNVVVLRVHNPLLSAMTDRQSTV